MPGLVAPVNGQAFYKKRDGASFTGLLLAAVLHIVRAALEVRHHQADILRAALAGHELVVFRLHPPPTTSFFPATSGWHWLARVSHVAAASAHVAITGTLCRRRPPFVRLTASPAR
ncbi:hypothetical protein K466DRAFT_607758 [Polyporus arcularius HHB13444]|uniref:Uncharacterized protein n=1 Tax=Polyporus arcularius HHB13444 TaxID=1314778 RepID=A0A5C3NJ28_9APHY|nr:hypothetical protein K466DRAFT_607758 [Polyporus arcularius HHB13444]